MDSISNSSVNALRSSPLPALKDSSVGSLDNIPSSEEVNHEASLEENDTKSSLTFSNMAKGCGYLAASFILSSMGIANMAAGLDTIRQGALKGAEIGFSSHKYIGAGAMLAIPILGLLGGSLGMAAGIGKGVYQMGKLKASDPGLEQAARREFSNMTKKGLAYLQSNTQDISHKPSLGKSLAFTLCSRGILSGGLAILSHPTSIYKLAFPESKPNTISNTTSIKI